MNGRRLSTWLVFPVALFIFTNACLAADEIQHRQPFEPIYRIPLRVHLGGSARPTEKWIPILEEINSIWLSQAGICFEMETVDSDKPMPGGLDLWFQAHVQDWNGYYCDAHDMHVRDDPDLGPAKEPAKSSAARTAAHELGHALHLPHRQDSDDNLMRSKTYGWQLNADEIRRARRSARTIALPDTKPVRCGPIATR